MLIPRRQADLFPGELERVLSRCAEEYAGAPEAIAAFEAAVRTYAGANAAAAVNSGRRGMALIFRHLGIGAGDEVIIPAYTLGDLAILIQKLGAVAVPADVDAATLNVTAEAIEARITPRTRAVLVLHAFGSPCDLGAIAAVAEKHGLPVIEDAAHALGARYRGMPVGAQTYAGFYSFEWTKPVNTYGGGMVLSADDALVESVRAATREDAPGLGPVAAKARAIQSEQRMFESGLARAPLTMLATPGLAGLVEAVYRRLQRVPPAGVAYHPLQAELGLQKLGTLEGRVAARERLAATLRAQIREDIRLQEVLPGCRSTWYFAVATLPVAAAPVRRALLRKGIDAGVGHEIADNLGDVGCPVVHEIAPRAIQLPLYESLDDETVRRIARTLNDAVGG